MDTLGCGDGSELSRDFKRETEADDSGPSREDTKTWSPDPVQPVLEGHSDWVRDVAWAPSVGVGRSYLASAGQVRARSLSSVLPR